MEASASVLQPPHPFCLFSHIHIASCPNGGSSGISPLPSAHKLSLMSSIFLSLWINHFEKQEYRMFTCSRNCHMLHDRKGGGRCGGEAVLILSIVIELSPGFFFFFFFATRKSFLLPMWGLLKGRPPISPWLTASDVQIVGFLWLFLLLDWHKSIGFINQREELRLPSPLSLFSGISSYRSETNKGQD